MKNSYLPFLIGLALCLSSVALHAQQFQKLYRAGLSLQVYDARQLPTGGYVMAGLVEFSATTQLFAAQLDCYGEVEWANTYGVTSSINNVRTKIIVLRDGNYVLLGNLGTFQNYNTLVSKLDPTGNIVWSRQLIGSRDDVGNDIVETSDGGLVVCGWTSSYGTDVSGSATLVDQYLVKLDGNGTPVWSTTVGNPGNVDRAYAIVEAADSGLVFSGSYLTQGHFFASIAKVDLNGDLQWLKCYGDTGHATHGYGLNKTSDGGFLLSGSTTILKTDFSSFGDNLLVRTDANGDSLWCRVYHGSNSDSFENAPSALEEPNGNLRLLSATASYPSTGFVPNKYAVLELDPQGNLMDVRGYQQGGSHYPILHPARDGGYLIAGYSNWVGYPVVGTFDGLLIKTDSNFSSGCNETLLNALTFQERPGFQQDSPPFTEDSGVADIAGTPAVAFVMQDTSSCENFVPLSAAFEFNPDSICSPAIVSFQDISTGAANQWFWDFGDGDTSALPNPTHTFGQGGVFTVTLMVRDTICGDMSVYTDSVTVYQGVEAAFTCDPGSPAEAGQDISFLDQSTGNPTIWSWDFGNGDTSALANPTYQYTDPDTYLVTLVVVDTVTGCIDGAEKPLVIQTVSVLPNVLTPNGDGINDELVFRGFEEYTIRVFDRWGKPLFNNNGDLNRFWDGRTSAGIECSEGVYYYIFEGTTFDDKEFRKVIWLMLLR